MFPLVFVIPSVVSGVAGAGMTAKGIADNHAANRINEGATSLVEATQAELERSRVQCKDMLADLGEEKLFVLNNSIRSFIENFEKIKNIDFTNSLGLEELRRLRIDRESMAELKEMQNFAATLAGGGALGLAGGALTAFGAYNAAMAFGAASTGTAISALSGAAATNATLAFFGGGSLAAGGAGMAGGMMVLGGLVAGPALLAMGLITGKQSDKKLDNAKANQAEAEKVAEELRNVIFQSNAIRRRTALFYTFLARLDVRLNALVFQLEDVIAAEGIDYSQYSQKAKSIVLRAATMAGSVKSLLDVPILDEDGALTVESGQLLDTLGIKLLES